MLPPKAFGSLDGCIDRQPLGLVAYVGMRLRGEHRAHDREFIALAGLEPYRELLGMDARATGRTVYHLGAIVRIGKQEGRSAAHADAAAGRCRQRRADIERSAAIVDTADKALRIAQRLVNRMHVGNRHRELLAGRDYDAHQA